MKHIKKRYVEIIMLFILGIFLYSPDIPLNELKKTYANQFSKFIGLRLAAEYNDFSESIFLQPLFEWTPNPFTIFYIGGNQNLIKEQEYYTDRSQFFIKFQYLISL